ncbi:MAG: 4-(cytidine 5'-diphospho)-2-C-methyl-D-erythritol kinase [Actinobacteria bacterium]|nr:4-(cytidine 5'-diphospho)-2-C-methyl-D-erythritol kinase [Actinomycetota bacterium]
MKITTAGSSLGIRIRTHAKVNLFLRVVGRRRDGYHEIESIFHGISLADDVDVRVVEGNEVEVEMHIARGPTSDAPQRETNLAYLAARALVDRGVTATGVHINIAKKIPIGAGLGGGSGNAAGVLVALNELWRAGLGDDDLNELGASVGSDVPYCLMGGTILVTGRGDKLTPLPSPRDLHFVLGISDQPLYTKDVYARWDELGAASDAGSAPITLALGGGDPREVAQLLHNDLEPAAFSLRPELEELKKVISSAGALGAGLTGSGPTLFGLASDAEHARDIAAKIEDRFDHVEIAHSTQHCVERSD